MRLNNNLSLTRSLGDQYMRQFGLVATPEIFSFKINPVENIIASKYQLVTTAGQELRKVQRYSSADKEDPELISYKMLSSGTKQLFYCFLSCDGVYEVFTPDQIDDIVRTLLSGKYTNNNGTDEIVLKSATCLFNG